MESINTIAAPLQCSHPSYTIGPSTGMKREFSAPRLSLNDCPGISWPQIGTYDLRHLRYLNPFRSREGYNFSAPRVFLPGSEKKKCRGRVVGVTLGITKTSGDRSPNQNRKGAQDSLEGCPRPLSQENRVDLKRTFTCDCLYGEGHICPGRRPSQAIPMVFAVLIRTQYPTHIGNGPFI